MSFKKIIHLVIIFLLLWRGGDAETISTVNNSIESPTHNMLIIPTSADPVAAPLVVQTIYPVNYFNVDSSRRVIKATGYWNESSQDSNDDTEGRIDQQLSLSYDRYKSDLTGEWSTSYAIDAARQTEHVAYAAGNNYFENIRVLNALGFSKTMYIATDLFWGVVLSASEDNAREDYSFRYDGYEDSHAFYIHDNGYIAELNAGYGRIYHADPLYKAKRIEGVLIRTGTIRAALPDPELLAIADSVQQCTAEKDSDPDTYISKACGRIVRQVSASVVLQRSVDGYTSNEISKVLQSDFSFRSYDHGLVLKPLIRYESHQGVSSFDSVIGEAGSYDTCYGITGIYDTIWGWQHVLATQVTAFSRNTYCYDYYRQTEEKKRGEYYRLGLELSIAYTYQLSDQWDVLAAVECETSELPRSSELEALVIHGVQTNYALKQIGLRNYLADDLMMDMTLSYTDLLRFDYDLPQDPAMLQYALVSHNDRTFQLMFTKLF